MENVTIAYCLNVHNLTYFIVLSAPKPKYFCCSPPTYIDHSENLIGKTSEYLVFIEIPIASCVI